MKKIQKKNIILPVLALVIYLLAQQGNGSSFALLGDSASDSSLQSAFATQQSNVQIKGQGIVRKVLLGDGTGLQHQKIILQVGREQTVLVAHNIDVAGRLPGLKQGDTVEFYGEYEWTAQGGVMHWTHRDPSGRHINGWLKYNGKTYQ